MESKTKEFETNRIILRKFKIEDAENMFNNYCNDDEVTRYLTWKSHKSLDDTKDFLNNVVLPGYEKGPCYRWAIVLKETNEVIGCIDVVDMNLAKKRAELGWVLGRKYWGRGIMPEAATIVRDYLFEEGFVRIQSLHDVENTKSGRVMEKIGMDYEGTLHKYLNNNDGELVDVKMYAIVK